VVDVDCGWDVGQTAVGLGLASLGGNSQLP